jgi:hypothetical protein
MDKKYMWNPKGSSNCPEAAGGLNKGQLVVHKAASEQEAQEQEILLLPEYTTTLFYNSSH